MGQKKTQDQTMRESSNERTEEAKKSESSTLKIMNRGKTILQKNNLNKKLNKAIESAQNSLQLRTNHDIIVNNV